MVQVEILAQINFKRSGDRYNVELRFKVYCISAGQTSLLLPSDQFGLEQEVAPLGGVFP